MAREDRTFLPESFRCKGCGKVTLLPKKVCPDCGSTEVELYTSSAKGEILNYSTIYFPPENYKGREPYTSVLVRLDNGCKVLGILEGEIRQLPSESKVTIACYNKDTGELVFSLD